MRRLLFLIGRKELIQVRVDVFLNLVELPGRNADRWEHGRSLFAILSDDEVSPTKVLEIVRERTKGTQNGIRVPARLEFDSFNFHDTSVKQIVDVDRQAAGVDA